MQHSTSYFSGKEKNEGIHAKNAMDSDSTVQSEADASALQRLLGASKDAEVLIACMFELHLITAAPLLRIWNKLAAAIQEAQGTLQAEHFDGPSALSNGMYRKRRP